MCNEWACNAFGLKVTLDMSTQARGGTRNFPMGELTLPMRGLKYGFQGTINAKNLRKNCISPSNGGLACSDGGL